MDELVERLHEVVVGHLATDPSDAEVLRGNIVLEAVGVDLAEFVRAKLANRGISHVDVKNAVAWARGQR